VPAATRPARSAVDRPLSLGPASRLLGVDPDTLRRWADEGRIESFTTAGGHRRFHRATVERILEARRHDATIRLASLGATTDRLSRAYRRGYSSGAEAGDVRAAIPTTERDAFRDGGRRLVGALLDHLDAPDDPGRARAEADAIAATDELTDRLAVARIAPDEAVSLFVAARRPFLTELGAIARRRALDPDRLLDRLLIRLVSRYPRPSAVEPGRRLEALPGGAGRPVAAGRPAGRPAGIPREA